MDKKYRVSPDEEFLDPEETLVDSFSGLSDVESPISNSFFSYILIFFIGVSVFFIINLVDLQILSGKEYKDIARQNISLNYFIPAPRGTIYDRQGERMAYDVPDFELLLVTKDIPDDEEGLFNFTKNLSDVMEKPYSEVEKLLEEQEDKALISFGKNIGKDKAIQLTGLSLPGVYVLPIPKREYDDGEYFSHIIGYTNKVSDLDLDDSYYKLQDKIGRIGIEKYYEETLRGTHGIRYFSEDSPEDNIVEGKSGNGLVLNIDKEVQKKLTLELSKILQSYGLKRGAAIMQNPNNGAVIAMVSLPSFDNNLFQTNLTSQDLENLFKDKDKPFFNRVTTGQYNPGSTIKPLLALAGLKEGVVTPQTTITDRTGYITIPNQYDPEIIYKYHDWKIQGTVNLKKALAQSSDIYFYSLGGGYGAIDGLGVEKLTSYYEEFFN